MTAGRLLTFLTMFKQKMDATITTTGGAVRVVRAGD